MADNEVVIKSGKTFSLGERLVDIHDNNTPVSFVDLVTEARESNGVVCFSFGSLIMDGGNVGDVHISSRMRMTLVTAQFLHGLLGDIIKSALKPVDKSQTN